MMVVLGPWDGDTKIAYSVLLKLIGAHESDCVWEPKEVQAEGRKFRNHSIGSSSKLVPYGRGLCSYLYHQDITAAVH